MRIVGILAFGCTLALAPQTLCGQDDTKRRIEFFAGYTFMADPDMDLEGLNISIAVPLTSWFSVVADYSAHSSSSESFRSGSPPFPGGSVPSISSFEDASMGYLLFGGQFTHRIQRLRPFARFMIGTQRITQESFMSIRTDPPIFSGSSLSANRTTLSVGGGLDISISPRFSWRAIQVDRLFQVGREVLGSKVRISSGLVVRF